MNVGRRALVPFGLVAYVSIARAQQSREPYAPLAQAVVTATGSEVDVLLDEISKFAAEKKLKIKRGDFPKEGQQVVNLTMHFETDTFFYLLNFLSPTKFELTAYSHDDPKVWRETWRTLLNRISSRLGKDHLRTVTDEGSVK